MICVFSPVKFCSFNTLIYTSKQYILTKVMKQELSIYSICFLKFNADTSTWHEPLYYIVIALQRMLGVAQRIQFRCFPFPNVQVYFWCALITWPPDNACIIDWINFISDKIRSSSVFCWYKIYAFYNILCRICKIKKNKRFRDSYLGTLKAYI